ncbi:hypothetical protein Tco_0726580 [Tanacetum coccineum]|uniref:Uncharacterized protein n=1 Tax=Tanacetum coccineum TaxID=301880 RepID=A0ABQ4YFY5_9ASTR
MRSRVEFRETRLEWSHVRQTGDKARLSEGADMAGQDVETLHARAEATEAETLQASLASVGAAQMDITDLLESHRSDRLEMAELQSRAHDISGIRSSLLLEHT